MIIDCHTHIFPDNLAEKAISKLCLAGGVKNFGKATLEGLSENMKKCGIRYSVTLPIATAPTQQKNINNFACGLNKDIFISFGSVNPYAEDISAELERIKKLGLKGIKLHPEYQNFYVDDERLYFIYRKAAELELPVIIHSGYDVAFPNNTHAQPFRLHRLIKNCSETVFILAHMGGLGLDLTLKEATEYIAGSNCFVDTSLSSVFLNRDSFMKFAEKHGIDKILFGSDYPWTDTQTEINFIENLPLSKKEKNKIFFNNAEKLFGI